MSWAYYLNPFSRREVVLRSPLSPAECAAALRGAIAPPSFFPKADPALVFRGQANEGSFVLRVSSNVRNSFRPFAHGRLEDTGHGTRIAVSLGEHLFTAVFVTFWVFMAASMTLPLAASGGTPPFIVLFPLFGVALNVFGRHLGRAEEATLIAELERLLQARVVEEG